MEGTIMKATKEDMLKIAEELSFSQYGILETSDLAFLPEVREMCAANRCNMYGKSWSCPPACGTLEEITEKAKAFSNGIVLQMTGQMEDDYDVETMMETEAVLKERFLQMIERLREKEVEHLSMSAGACTLCEKCTYPDEPCRFPEKVSPSMEAFGLIVSDCCKAAGIKYYYGPQTITFSACVLF